MQWVQRYFQLKWVPLAIRAASRKSKKSRVDPKRSERILSYMNYYFGADNLSTDLFMLKEFERNDGWISGRCLCTFPKLRALGSIMPQDLSEAVAASMHVKAKDIDGEIFFRPANNLISIPMIQEKTAELNDSSLQNMSKFRHNCKIRSPRTFKNVDSVMKRILREADNADRDGRYFPVGFDIEYASIDKGGEKLPAVLSLSCRSDNENFAWLIWLDRLDKRGFCIDDLPPSLMQVMSDPRVLKVGVGASNDAKALASVWTSNMGGGSSTTTIRNFVELSHFIKDKSIDQIDSPFSLENMCARFLNRRLLKIKSRKENAKKSHWRANQMTDLMIDYAADDVAVAWQLYHELVKDSSAEDIDIVVKKFGVSYDIAPSDGSNVALAVGSAICTY